MADQLQEYFYTCDNYTHLLYLTAPIHSYHWRRWRFWRVPAFFWKMWQIKNFHFLWSLFTECNGGHMVFGQDNFGWHKSWDKVNTQPSPKKVCMGLWDFTSFAQKTKKCTHPPVQKMLDFAILVVLDSGSQSEKPFPKKLWDFARSISAVLDSGLQSKNLPHHFHP